MELKRGDLVRHKGSYSSYGSYTIYLVIALTDGDNVWVADADNLKRNGGLIWNGATGEAWEDFTTPKLIPARDCEVIA